LELAKSIARRPPRRGELSLTGAVRASSEDKYKFLGYRRITG
jgi:hypothetical protein